MVNYDLLEDNGWQPDFEGLEKMDLSRVRLMWTNYPNMPTGGAAQMATYEKLVDFAKRHNIVVVNDNPYSFILNDNPVSLLQVPGAKDYCIESPCRRVTTCRDGAWVCAAPTPPSSHGF